MTLVQIDALAIYLFLVIPLCALLGIIFIATRIPE
jgi:hypothetical protein